MPGLVAHDACGTLAIDEVPSVRRFLPAPVHVAQIEEDALGILPETEGLDRPLNRHAEPDEVLIEQPLGDILPHHERHGMRAVDPARVQHGGALTVDVYAHVVERSALGEPAVNDSHRAQDFLGAYWRGRPPGSVRPASGAYRRYGLPRRGVPTRPRP